MLLHIGGDVGVPLEKVVLLLNERGMTRETKAYLARAKSERRFVACHGAAKSYVVLREPGRERILASPISSATLEKRWREAARTPVQLLKADRAEKKRLQDRETGKLERE